MRHRTAHSAATVRAGRALGACRNTVRLPLCRGSRTELCGLLVSQARACWAVEQQRATPGSSLGAWALAVAASEAARGARGAVHARRTQEPGERRQQLYNLRRGAVERACVCHRRKSMANWCALLKPSLGFGLCAFVKQSWAASSDVSNQYRKCIEALLPLMEPAWAQCGRWPSDCLIREP